MLKALLWKEWHEQRGRMALATVWLLGMTTIGLKTRILPDRMIIVTIWTAAVILLPVFLGMGLLATERKNGTWAYLLARPVSGGRILIAKTVAGLMACVTPFVISAGVICLAIGGREMRTSYLAGGLALLTALGAILFAWQFLAGWRCRREETYVVVSGIVLGCWAMHAFVVEEWRLTERVGFWTWAVSPFAIPTLDQVTLREFWTTVTLQSVILAGLGFGLWLRFRRLREGQS